MSHPTRVRGLKPVFKLSPPITAVAPHTGAWIETNNSLGMFSMVIVAPHTGAWIETGCANDFA